jgi:hypothetical protein
MKVAIVIPIAKEKLSLNPADYRPISLLPIISKIVEKCISEFIPIYQNHSLVLGKDVPPQVQFFSCSI